LENEEALAPEEEQGEEEEVEEEVIEKEILKDEGVNGEGEEEEREEEGEEAVEPVLTGEININILENFIDITDTIIGVLDGTVPLSGAVSKISKLRRRLPTGARTKGIKKQAKKRRK
jgi:hypothetical protein